MSSRKISDVSHTIPPEPVRAPTPPPPARSYLPDDYIVLDIKGKEVVMGPPPGGTMRRIATILGNDTKGNFQVLLIWLKALMYVRSIDGVQVSPLTDMVMAQKLSDQLGDYGEDIVMTAYEQYCPAPSKEELPLIKK